MFAPLPTDLTSAIEAARSRLGPYADVRFREEVDSTNDVALALAAAGAPAGTSVLADVQRRGRGRRGHEWFSPPGAGLYLSLVTRPRVDEANAALVTLAAGVATAQAVVATTGLPVELKWPNDLVIGRPWRKLGGILTEASTRGGRIEAIVIGIGVNLSTHSFPPDIGDRATALETELGRAVPRATVLVALLEALQTVLRAFEAPHPGVPVTSVWKQFGRRAIDAEWVRWTTATGERRGRTRDVAPDGMLVVEVDGRLERIVAGDVIWEGLSRG